MYRIEMENSKNNTYWSIVYSTPDFMVSTNGIVTKIPIKCSALLKDFDAEEWLEWQSRCNGLVQQPIAA